MSAAKLLFPTPKWAVSQLSSRSRCGPLSISRLEMRCNDQGLCTEYERQSLRLHGSTYSIIGSGRLLSSPAHTRMPWSSSSLITTRRHETTQASAPYPVAVAAQNVDKDGIYTEIEAEIGPFIETPTVPNAQPVVVVISGPSGVGKDAVIKRLQESRPDLYFVVTATSRKRREGELHGVDYFFVSAEEFEQMIKKDELLEHAIVYGEYKGIPKNQVRRALAAGTDVVLRLDIQGAKSVREMIPQVVSIFLVAENEKALVQRLVARKTETKEKLLLRVNTAREETQRFRDFDYVVVNEAGHLDQTVARLAGIIDAERHRIKDEFNF